MVDGTYEKLKARVLFFGHYGRQLAVDVLVADTLELNEFEFLESVVACLLTNGLPDRNEMSRSYAYMDHQIQLRV